ncbi:hypothetical protein Zmor_004308 [Zophobas morio]|uniref:Uncharacterized protein n=1 Tax=Zophobas morio TaxID=2755281 RepID=A0AA38LZH4_9CUCU|nr:hypothetical protein Zmor_004308 [Zophobas morio]
MLNQIYADITGKEIFIAEELQAPAVSSALYGAVAAGEEAGGFKDIATASQKLGRLKKESVKPNLENKKVYDQIYEYFKRVHDFFGVTDKDIMSDLKALKVIAHE